MYTIENSLLHLNQGSPPRQGFLPPRQGWKSLPPLLGVSIEEAVKFVIIYHKNIRQKTMAHERRRSNPYRGGTS